ncbi:hypothetical protein Sinac_0160 [Singulisphaera acidiphila DSM 18658]|uniref:Uncharacterized protein n=1 Tax=Singulisphaera acidiphila (strain ATCC BAA-1392 / DSM 18658 / VKM B-2454 / MOB10) TaxID=886293 RepID=L0D5T1_SINAD|nr:hypothetical protein Sinac_0160 [Singulisphaera acidiphila DSM 18658]
MGIFISMRFQFPPFIPARPTSRNSFSKPELRLPLPIAPPTELG